MNTKHRPPHGRVKIEELIKLGRTDEAQTCCDENVDFYHAKIEEQQDLFLLAACKQIGVEPTPESKLAVAMGTPKRRRPPATCR